MNTKTSPRLRTSLQPPRIVQQTFVEAKRRFKKLKELGRGWFGVVYRGSLRGQSVVVKIAEYRKTSKRSYRPDLAMRSLVNEIRILLKIQELPFVPRLLEIGKDYFVMEDVAGHPLRKLLEEGSPAEAIRALASMGAMVSELHQRGIAHADVGPGNALSTKEGVVLIDFGLSVESGREDPFVTLTRVQSFNAAMKADLLLILAITLALVSDRPADIFGPHHFFGLKPKKNLPEPLRAAVIVSTGDLIGEIRAGQFNDGTGREIWRALTGTLRFA